MSGIVYLFKLSVAICVFYGLYRTVLSSLTFFVWRRVYLLAGSLLACLLPLLHLSVTPVLVNQNISVFTPIPSVQDYVNVTRENDSFQAIVPVVLLIIGTGIAIRCTIVLWRYFSLIRIRSNAIHEYNVGRVRVFSVRQPIAPFSFGRSIFIHYSLHSEAELEQIIAHESAHVHQYHTADLLLAELLCIVNWFNPCAWWVRTAIRENLEFAADSEVLARGFPTKPYQYLLLAFARTPAPAMGHYFNISSLQKRIVMINRPHSRALQLSRFFLVLPAILVVVAAFRTAEPSTRENSISPVMPSPPVSDTVPANTTHADAPVLPDVRSHYFLSLADNDGESIVVIRNAQHHIIKAVTLTDWKRNDLAYVRQYGSLPESLTLSSEKSGSTMTIMADKIAVSTPLYVVNGIIQPLSFDIHSIDPATISQVSVLKGKGATDKYGDAGKAGVVELYKKTTDAILDSAEKKINYLRPDGSHAETVKTVTSVRSTMPTQP
ncbi:MAG: hypothetical protein H0X41_02900 [Chitinophagaceae bacterium]|nr:hypothetical protein [Chitinophagaceae bacterium]